MFRSNFQLEGGGRVSSAFRVDASDIAAFTGAGNATTDEGN